jgi:hypothetical protein
MGAAKGRDALVPDPPRSCMIAPQPTPRNESNISGRDPRRGDPDPIGPELCSISYANFGEFLFHALG